MVVANSRGSVSKHYGLLPQCGSQRTHGLVRVDFGDYL